MKFQTMLAEDASPLHPPHTHTPLEDGQNKGGENDLPNVPLEDMG